MTEGQSSGERLVWNAVAAFEKRDFPIKALILI